MAQQGGKGDTAYGCGCLLLIFAVVVMLGAGWYFAVREQESFFGAGAIRTTWGWVTRGPPDLDREYLEAAMLRRVNDRRVEYGWDALQTDDHLAAIALAHSRDMAENGYYPDDHLNLRGENPTRRARRAGYECVKPGSIGVAENAALGYRHNGYREYRLYGFIPMGRSYIWMTEDELASEIVLSWMLSPGHYRNLMNPRYTRSGLGVAFGTIDGDKHAVLVTHKFC